MKLDAIVVGAGFAGIYMLHKLKGSGLSVRLIESGKDVGGAWYWNRYPGVRCDVESLDYQYQFSEDIYREWRWPERYSEGPVIQRYLAFVTDRLGMRSDIVLNTRVETATYDETAQRWTLTTNRGARLDTHYLILSVGPLTTTVTPDFPGMEDFEGRTFHTARWPEQSVDFSDRQVAVIGTGSSGIQCIPVIAKQAKSLTVFQRTPAYSIPVFNRALSDEEISRARECFAEDRERRRKSPAGTRTMASSKGTFEVTPEERVAEFERRWRMGGFPFLLAYHDTMINADANEEAARFVRRKIHEKVKNPRVADMLTPTTYPLGTKRPCLDTGYYETFNEPHVSLIDVRADPIERFYAAGIIAGGRRYTFDDIVLATGFDALTGAVLKINVQGRNGLEMGTVWSSGPRSYLGISVAGFPNLFILDGPGSPSILVNAPAVIEQQVEWVADCIGHMEDNGIAAIEADEQAQNEWVAHVDEVANYTLYPRADSWAIGANIPGKPRVFMLYLGGLPAYREKCDTIALSGYAGFHFENCGKPVESGRVELKANI